MSPPEVGAGLGLVWGLESTPELEQPLDDSQSRELSCRGFPDLDLPQSRLQSTEVLWDKPGSRAPGKQLQKEGQTQSLSLAQENVTMPAKVNSDQPLDVAEVPR